MVSGVISRTFEWDPEVSQEDLDAINGSCQGKQYVDEDAATEINGTPLKPELIINNLSFLKFVEIGSGGDGWWNGANMHLLLEDLADCLSVMYPGKKFILFTDWCQGHAQKHPDGLKASDMNKSYGGCQVKSHSSCLTFREFGIFSNPGMLPKPEEADQHVEQPFMFAEEDAGPCWLSPEEKQYDKYDHVIEGETKREYLKWDDLHKHLRTALEPDLPANFNNLTKSQLVALAKARGIPHFQIIQKVKPGWVGQAKGLLQICYECGLVDGVTYTGKALYNRY